MKAAIAATLATARESLERARRNRVTLSALEGQRLTMDGFMRGSVFVHLDRAAEARRTVQACRAGAIVHVVDEAHGWLRVPAAMVAALGLKPEQFSAYSYKSEAAWYLEEDVDAARLAAIIGRPIDAPQLYLGRNAYVRRLARLGAPDAPAGGPATEATAQGLQYVIPGAERRQARQAQQLQILL